MTIREVKTAEFCLVGDGTHSSIKRTDTGIMYLSSKNFSKDGIILNKVDYISQLDYEKYFKGSSTALTKPQENDLIFSIIGSIGGVYLYKKEDCFGLSSSVAMIRVNSVELDAHYLFFYLKSNFLQKWAEIIKSGSAQGFLSLSMIRSLPLLFPPLKIQQKIASILSNYDKLIENNTQRIKLLESMAEEMYKEWFVRLRFPGYEDVEVVDGLPVGWERKSLGDCVNNFDSKRIPLSKKVRETKKGIYPYYGAASILDYIDSYIFEGKYLLLGEDGTVITKRGTPMLQFISGKFWVSNHAHVLTGKLVSIEYLYLFLNSYPILGLITGAAQPKINQKNLNRIKMLVPSDEILKEFNKLVISIFEEIFILKQKNKLLKQIRDLLIPRLMSGKLNVEDLDII